MLLKFLILVQSYLRTLGNKNTLHIYEKVKKALNTYRKSNKNHAQLNISNL